MYPLLNALGMNAFNSLAGFQNMIKVFEDFDIALVGHYQSVLESNGIPTFMKNQFGTSGAGELPLTHQTSGLPGPSIPGTSRMGDPSDMMILSGVR